MAQIVPTERACLHGKAADLYAPWMMMHSDRFQHITRGESTTASDAEAVF
jgi:hypothetical protein